MAKLTFTVQRVLDLAKQIEPMDPKTALEQLNIAHCTIATYVKMYPETQLAVSLVANQMMYSLSASVGSIWSATLFTGANSYLALLPTNVDTLYNDVGPDWRQQTQGQPYLYFEEGGQLGIYPPPNQSTAGTYPNVTISYSAVAELTASDSLPSMVNTPYPWIYAMCAAQCVVNGRPEKKPEYDKLQDQAMQSLQTYIFRRTARDRNRFGLNVPMVRGA